MLADEAPLRDTLAALRQLATAVPVAEGAEPEWDFGASSEGLAAGFLHRSLAELLAKFRSCASGGRRLSAGAVGRMGSRR